MFRPFCYGLICFILLGSSFALRQALSSAALHQASAALDGPLTSSSRPTPESYPNSTATLKSDKLAMTLPQHLLDTATVRATAIQPAPDVAPSVSKSVEITTWHWHAGSKITKKTRNVPDTTNRGPIGLR